MANTYIRSSAIVSVNGTYSIYINGRYVENDLRTPEAADAALDWWQRNYREDSNPRAKGAR